MWLYTLNAAIGLVNRYRHTNPLNTRKMKNLSLSQCYFNNEDYVHNTLDSMENHLLPEGGTEHTSAAPAISGYGVSISKIKRHIRTSSVLVKTS